MKVFWYQWREGASIADAAAVAGVSAETGRRHVVLAGGVAPRRQQPPSGRYLSFAEREEIAVLHAAKLSNAEIGRRLGRHPSTIGRELERNKPLNRDGYRASTAQWKAEQSARRPKAAKLAKNRRLRKRVQKLLGKKWSPEQIAASLRRDFPDRPEMWVSHETIYQAIYVQGRGALRRELATCLRTGRAVRRPKRRVEQRRSRIPVQLLISQRPAEVEDRAVPGHWEGDLILGKNNASAIGTLVERSTRFCLLLHLPHGHDAEQVSDAMIATITELPAHLRRSLTWDQGTEMARHAEITLAAELAIYFCDPHSPWQRGSNENTNGLLRQYFPKGTDLSRHSAEHLAAVAAELNERPRKTLGWRSPAQAFNTLLQPDSTAA